jgi:hypothetical protein
MMFSLQRSNPNYTVLPRSEHGFLEFVLHFDSCLQWFSQDFFNDFMVSAKTGAAMPVEILSIPASLQTSVIHLPILRPGASMKSAV